MYLEEKLNLCSVLSKFTGKPASLYETRHVDWVPRQNLGYSTAKVTNEDLSRNKRAFNRRIERARLEETAKCCLHVGKESNKVENEGQDKSFQTDFNLGILKEDLSMSKAQIATLEQEVSAYKIDRKYFETNNDRLQFYTGLPNIETLDAVFELIEHFISETSQSVLSKFMQFILFLMRIRLNLSVEDLGYRFKISFSTVSRIFLNVLDIMFHRLSFLVKWPSREILWETTPMCFRKHFKTKVCIIIDCF